MARIDRLHDPEHNPPTTHCRNCGIVISNISGRRRFCDEACELLADPDNRREDQAGAVSVVVDAVATFALIAFVVAL